MSEQKYASALGQQNAYPQTKRDTVGISGLEGRIDAIEVELSGIWENLIALQGRLYPPHPSPVGNVNDGAVSPSIENSLNRIINKMQDLRRLSNELLHG